MGYPSSTVDLTEAEKKNVVADAFEWGTKVANRYVAHFGSDEMFSNSVYGDLADVGWAYAENTVPSALNSNSNGDLDAADDTEGGFAWAATIIEVNGDYVASPKVVGGWPLIEGISAITGQRPTTITCWIVGRWRVTTDAADSSGFGLAEGWDNTLTGNSLHFTIGATNFEVWNGSAAADTGVTKDINAHRFEFVIDLATETYTAKIDGVEVVTATALAVNSWPRAMQAYHGASGADMYLHDWGVNYD